MSLCAVAIKIYCILYGIQQTAATCGKVISLKIHQLNTNTMYICISVLMTHSCVHN